MTRVDVFTRAEAVLGEGPSWDANAQRLLWVDILARRVMVVRAGETQTVELPYYVSAAVATAVETTLLIALAAGVATLDLATGETAPVASTGADPRELRVNDAKVDPVGRLWVGTMAIDEAPCRGALHRLDHDGRLERVLDGLTVSNGPAFSHDGACMYHVDSPTRTIRRFPLDLDDGRLGPGEPFAETSALPGVPDGMTVDAHGNLWVAFWDGSAVRCFSGASGELLDVVELPVSRPTSCAFGGRGLDRLLVTSARVGLSEEQLRNQPLAGSVLAVDAGVSGCPAVTAHVPDVDDERATA